MSKFIIEGGTQLEGELVPQGAKNEALQIISAILLTTDKVTINNIPEIADVLNLIDLLKNLGVEIHKIKDNTYTFEAKNIDLSYLYSEQFKSKSGLLRGSVLIVGPLLAKYGKAFLPKPGGDKIGRRRLDTHFNGLIELGAQINYDFKDEFYEISSNKLKGKYIMLQEASVTGTANIIMASIFAEGTTTIYNAACEPYIQQLCKMLNSMGANISGIGSNLLTIVGCQQLHGTQHHILPDMIEIGSFIGLAAMTNSNITIKNCSIENLGIIPSTFKKLGINMNFKNDDIEILQQDFYEISTFMDGSILTLADAPWPGFTPDLLSIVLVVATQAKGSLLIHQKMFESRLFFVDKLIDMGAQIILCDPHRATVIGLARQQKLRAAKLISPDIRAGMALLIAAMSANGVSQIENIEQIDRGYQNLDIRLNKIGANIIRM